MENKHFTKDEFAIFMADIIKGIGRYNFDVLLDIGTIIKQKEFRRGSVIDMPVCDRYYLCYRDTGCDLIDILNEYRDTYFNNNSFVYELTFCWNYEYMTNIPFVSITTIKVL